GPELPGAEGELQDKRERAIEPNEATKRNKRTRGATEGATDSVQEPVNAAEVERLRQRDREVRNHELAHAAAAGPYGGPPRYELERGPDGTMYATGGNVRIDVSPVPGDPDATIRKMRQVRRAALAPAEPSAQDRRVAAPAAAEEAKARSALRRTQAQERETREAAAAEGGAPQDDPGQTESLGRGARTVMTLNAQRAYARGPAGDG
ncbi:MAG: putative metalloprotease CJM1_0395 family protein, partial [Myxococcota bacterium]